MYTLHYCTAGPFVILEVNTNIHFGGRIWWTPLHFREYDLPRSIDMIEIYHWTFFLVPKVWNRMIYDFLKCSWSFNRFRWNGTVHFGGQKWQLPLHFQQQDHPCSIDVIESYQWTLWSVPKVRNRMIYDFLKCSWSFNHFRWKWVLLRGITIWQCIRLREFTQGKVPRDNHPKRELYLRLTTVF